ncbi:hypothetical protein BHE74_00006632 [Ensete ventricosum]|nr:hypothetical protein BHE74_00006632 [Ensete ventricosum]
MIVATHGWSKMEETRKVPEASGKRPAKVPSGQRKKAKVPGRHKSHREGENSKSWAAMGKETIASVEGTSTPRARLKSVKELCNACPGEDGLNYHVIRIPWLATDLYTLPSEILMDQAAKTMVLVSSVSALLSLSFMFANALTWLLTWQSHHYYMTLIDRVQRRKDGGNPNTVAATKRWASEAQSLADHLKTELEEATRRRELLEKELSEIQGTLSDSQDQLAETREQLVNSWSKLFEAREQPANFEDQLQGVRIPGR